MPRWSRGSVLKYCARDEPFVRNTDNFLSHLRFSYVVRETPSTPSGERDQLLIVQCGHAIEPRLQQ